MAHYDKNQSKVEILMNFLSNAWTVPILLVLEREGTVRFGALRDKVRGISGRVLAVRLKRMEELGYVTRFSHPTSPPQVDYTLSESGKELCKFLSEVKVEAESLIPAGD